MKTRLLARILIVLILVVAGFASYGTTPALAQVDQYTLTTNVNGSGSITLDPAGGLYDDGTIVTVTAVPAVGWVFTGWSDDLTGTTNPETITMDADKTVTATFVEEFDLTTAVVGNGSITLDPTGGTYADGTVVSVEAVPDTDWQFTGWSDDLTGTTNPDTITMDADKTVTATFEIQQYTLTVNTVGNGTVTLDPAGGTYDGGTVVTLTAVPDSGWGFSGWSDDLTGTTNPETITMTGGNSTVTATFVEIAPFNALDLGTSDGHVTFSNEPALGLDTFTLETWFMREGEGTTAGTGGINAIPLVTKGRGEGDGDNRDMNYFLGIDPTSDVLAGDFEEGATATTPGENHPLTGVTTIVDGVWYHAALTYDGTTLSLYLNGNLENSIVVGEPPRSDSIQHSALGAALTSTGIVTGHFDGVLDEVRIWDFARTADEIQTDINTEISTSQTGLVARWGLDEGIGSTVSGSAGTTINGSIGGTGYSWVGNAPFNISISAPTTPSGLGATPDSQTEITVSWTDDVLTETSFELERSTTGSSGPFTLLDTLSANTDTYLDSGLTAETEYCYQLRSVNTAGSSAYTTPVCATTLAPVTDPPAAPTDLAAIAASPDQIDLTWTDNATVETGFEIERSTTGIGGPFTLLDTAAIDATGYSDTGLTSETEYCYQVRAVNGIGPSGYTGPVCATTDALTPPAAPTDLAATAASHTQVDLTWTDNASDETGFEIERSTTGSGGPFTLLDTAAVDATGYSDSGLTPETEYCYQVRAVNAYGSSAYTSVFCATTEAEPNYGLDLGTADGHVTFGNNAALGLDTFTLETWFMREGTGTTTSTGTGGVTAIPLVTKGRAEGADGSTNDMNYFLGIDPISDVLTGDFEEGATATTPGENHPLTGATTIVNDAWYHAALTYDGTTLSLYLNG
ncbi:MAG: fibronectin type III domain-containing protein, partial [Anaerolineales bacterium]|nr:fibronectin type III domain-containing protein [Anaerolineales bacterium]